MFDDLLQIRSLGVNFYVLRDAQGLYLIDGGFIRGRDLLRRALIKQGWDHERIIGIIVSHGHLDHILNISTLAEETGAWIAAPRLDEAHYQGRPHYQGAARITGFLECIGRPLLGFRPFVPTRLLDHGDFLDIWHGLSVVHLPGHTAGHSGFYCARHKLLFSADLFASYRVFPHLPPPMFNSCPEKITISISKALELDLNGILPNHGDTASPQVHLQRLITIHRNMK
jgi:glyoxylase-like metal-dependent hydrolase (beta-lactamase superfamily II)